ncbi:hypothetical protein MNB_SV-13-206 [hydrothermal vent metagenome]|uniref:Uncharacterized protein n=1 Tax=hydrothermal vent metagenome TaxID=652676 RepID=A0A1W1CYL2_9ZZZZ
MTKKEVSINTTWDEFEMGTCRVFLEVLQKYIPIIFFQEHRPKPSISSKMLQALNDILDIEKEEFDRLESILGTEVYAQSKIKEIHIDQDNDKYHAVYAELILNVSSKSLITVIIEDKKFICLNDGTYFDALEVSEEEKEEAPKMSKENREKLVAMMLSS